MKLTDKLLGYLSRAFRRDPLRFLALRLRYDGAMSWRVENARLTTSVTGGTGAPLDIDLTHYTLLELASHLEALPGYQVAFRVPGDPAALGARVLLDGEGDQGARNGDHLYAYSALEYAYLESVSSELKVAREQVGEMLQQLTTRSASQEWLDEIGGYYGVFRRSGESDAAYGSRIVSEVIRPRNNNKAIELAITEAAGSSPSRVVDVQLPRRGEPLYDGRVLHDGQYAHNYDFPLYDGERLYDGASRHDYNGVFVRNLFDVHYDFDLEGGEPLAAYQLAVRGLIDRFRAAGTHLHNFILTARLVTDAHPGVKEDALVVVPTLGVTDTFCSPDGDYSPHRLQRQGGGYYPRQDNGYYLRPADGNVACRPGDLDHDRLPGGSYQRQGGGYYLRQDGSGRLRAPDLDNHLPLAGTVTLEDRPGPLGDEMLAADFSYHLYDGSHHYGGGGTRALLHNSLVTLGYLRQGGGQYLRGEDGHYLRQ